MKKIIKVTEIRTINCFDETVSKFEVIVSVDRKIKGVSLSGFENCPEEASFERVLDGVCDITEMLVLVYKYTKKGYELRLERLEEK